MTGAPPSDGTVTPLSRRDAVAAPWAGPAAWLCKQRWLAGRPRLESGWASVRGVGHARNQDAVLAAAPLFAVADGVGGGSAGELASSQLLAWCRDIPVSAWRRPETLAARLRGADAALAQALQTLSPGGSSATTFAGAWLRADGRGLVAHVGDTRVLQLRPRRDAWQLTRLTADQTYTSLGEVPPTGSRPDDPARMVGVGAIGDPPVARLRVRENDWLLLCSDGLHRFVPEPTLAALLAGMCRHDAAAPLHVLAQRFAQAAVQAGSRDDISVLLVRRNPVGGARVGFWLAAAASVAMALLLPGAWRLAPTAETGARPAPAPVASAPSTAGAAAPLSPR